MPEVLIHAEDWRLNTTYTSLMLMLMLMLPISRDELHCEAASDPDAVYTDSASTRQAISPREYRALMTYKASKPTLPQS
jgi:hypothetical protein